MVTKKEDPAVAESTEVAVREATGVPVRSGDFISRYLREETENPNTTSGATHLAIIEEIVGGRTVEDILNAPDPIPMEELVGRHLVLHGFRAQESEFEEGPPIYFTLNVTDGDTGDKLIVNTGEQAVMAQVEALDREGLLPQHVTVKQARRANRFNRFPIRFTQWKA